MTTEEIFQFVCKDIHTTVFATCDAEGLPVTSVIDLMLAKGEKLYFLTAKGKSFYKRLMATGYVAFSGIVGEDTMSSVSVSVRSKVTDVGSGLLEEIFDKNAYMKQIYPTKASMEALTVFELYEGEGEYFDLSKKPIERFRFVFGGEKDLERPQPYSINARCTGCGDCLPVCPTSCIKEGEPFSILEEHCLHCGNCYNVCTYGAVVHID